MHDIFVRLKQRPIPVAIVGGCFVLLVGVAIGRCVAAPTEVFVSGALVTPGALPAPPPEAVVIAQPTDFGGPRKGGLNALRGLVYVIPETTLKLADVSSLRPIAILYTTQLDIEARSWKSGFPGVPGGRNEWFQIAYEGELATARAGAHHFDMLSDDGSRLFIDGALVIDNDGRHPPQGAQGSIELKPGRHRMRVDYFQGPRYEVALQLFVTPPQSVRQVLDVSSVL